MMPCRASTSSRQLLRRAAAHSDDGSASAQFRAGVDVLHSGPGRARWPARPCQDAPAPLRAAFRFLAGKPVQGGEIQKVPPHAEIKIECLLLEHDTKKARAARGSLFRSCPPRLIRPDGATSNPVSNAKSVDFPAPFGPSSAQKRPGSTRKPTLSSARRGP